MVSQVEAGGDYRGRVYPYHWLQTTVLVCSSVEISQVRWELTVLIFFGIMSRIVPWCLLPIEPGSRDPHAQDQANLNGRVQINTIYHHLESSGAFILQDVQ